MGWFPRKAKHGVQQCSSCRYYVMLNGHGYCAKDVLSTVNVRLLSAEGIRRQCVRCPAAMTCPIWEAR